MALPGNTPLADAQVWLRNRVDKGERCPCCTQFAKVYRRKINSGMARSLIRMYHISPGDWIHLPTEIGARSREEGKLAYWGLVEEENTLRPDGGRAGYWRITPLGHAFVLGNIALPKYARIYDGRCLGLDTSEKATIKDALGTAFDYDDLMQGI